MSLQVYFDAFDVREHGCLGLLDLIAKWTRLETLVEQDVYVVSHVEITIDKLILHMLHAVVFAVGIKRIWLPLPLILLNHALLASFNFHDGLPVDEAFTRLHEKC